MLRLLADAGVRLPCPPPRLPRPAPRQRRPFPDWAKLLRGVVWSYDVTHVSGLPGWCTIAVINVVSKKFLVLNLNPEETSIQVETAFIGVLHANGRSWLLGDEEFVAELATGHVPDPELDPGDDGTGAVPVLLAVSDNGPQITSSTPARFMATARIGQHFGRPSTPNDQAWIDSFFGHLKTEHPDLDTITDAAQLTRELEHLQTHYNTVRLHEAIGYVIPDDERHRTGPVIRKARKECLRRAGESRVATRHRRRRNRTHKPSIYEGK